MQLQLNYMDGEPQMPNGLQGTVVEVDDIGQIRMRWANGSSLALDPDLDQFNIIAPAK